MTVAEELSTDAVSFVAPSRRTKKKDIYVISTPKRPVPLEHHIYAGRDMYKIVDAKGSFLGAGSVIGHSLHQ